LSLELNRKSLHIKRSLSVVLLLVFAIALTPFSIFHHHEESPRCEENLAHAKALVVDLAAVGNSVYGADHDHSKSCSHKFHISGPTDHCLICSAHFEKSYTNSEFHYQVYQDFKPVSKRYSAVSGSFTELVGSSLRGPPLV
jgi:hypothetical protein